MTTQEIETLRQLIQGEVRGAIKDMKEELRDEVLSGVKLLVENQVTAQINTLAEGHKELAENQQDIKKKLAAIADLQDEMPVIKAAIKTHTTQIKANTAEIDELKKAQ